MTEFTDGRDEKWQCADSHTWCMITFLDCALAISIIRVIMMLTSDFIFDFLLDLISMAKTYLRSVPTMTALLLSFFLMMSKVMM